MATLSRWNPRAHSIPNTLFPSLETRVAENITSIGNNISTIFNNFTSPYYYRRSHPRQKQPYLQRHHRLYRQHRPDPMAPPSRQHRPLDPHSPLDSRYAAALSIQILKDLAARPSLFYHKHRTQYV